MIQQFLCIFLATRISDFCRNENGETHRDFKADRADRGPEWIGELLDNLSRGRSMSLIFFTIRQKRGFRIKSSLFYQSNDKYI